MKTILKSAAWAVILSILLSVFMTFYFTLLSPWAFKREITPDYKNIYPICKKLLDSSLVKDKKTKFYINYDPFLSMINYGGGGFVIQGKIYFLPWMAFSSFFEVVAAHELGHTEVSANQHEADLFAIRLLGNEKREDFRSALKVCGRSDKEINSTLEEFDLLYNSKISGIYQLAQANWYFLSICQEIEYKYSKPGHTPIIFLINQDLKEAAFSNIIKGKPIVSFSPSILAHGETVFKVFAAHEIGHIVLSLDGQNVFPDQIACDDFAARVVGSKETVRNVYKTFGMIESDPRYLALSK